MVEISPYGKGKKYEEFVKSIYEAILSEDGYLNIVVEMNKTDMTGLSGLAHQIDIYWEFEIGENRYQTAIECKNYKSPVSIGKIRDFHGVLTDLPKLNGVFVSSNGFQKGAIQYAKTHGITLKQIRETKESDFDGRIKEIHLTSHLITTHISRFEPIPTQSYLASIPINQEIRLEFKGTNYDTLIVTSANEPLASHADIQNSLPNNKIAEKGKTWLWKKPDSHFKSSDGCLIPIDAVYVEYDVNVISETSVSYAQDFVRGIIKDVATGTQRFIKT